MIIETILTTVDAAGSVNSAPMGVEWGQETVVIKPFQNTATYRNLSVTRAAVINITDNVLLFAQSAISRPVFPVHPAVVIAGAILDDVCSWREVRVEAIDTSQPRARMTARVVYRGVAREFIGFNRAQTAVLEAAILSTRTHCLPASQILADFARLQIIVDKTAGPQEHEAMNLLTHYVRTVLNHDKNSKD